MNSEESENLEVKILFVVVVVAKTQVDVPVYVVESILAS